ncbi:baseplate J/gp47 family protein [Enterococcus casseliflavus]|uniref:baseplate J/gp47 family protein n=1 Tax=Enterococcus TaxID=1350 RepID=UPI0039A5A12D
MIVQKTKEEMIQEMYATLQSKLGINTTQDGSIAKAIVDATAEEIYFLYEQAKFMQDMSYVSTSTGEYLNKLAELVGISREELESDENLKRRTTNAVYTLSGGNFIAIEEAIMSVSGVAEYEFRKYSKGPGSFTVYIYPEQGQTNEFALVQKVKNAISEAVSEGITFEVEVPISVVVDLQVLLQFTDKSTEMEKRDIRNKVFSSITNYLNSMKKNEMLIINEIIQRTMDTSEKIIDMGVINLVINGKPLRISNTSPLSNQRFVPGTITVL